MSGGCLNRVTLIGNVGADPEIKQLPSGSKAAKLRLATSESWKDASGEKQSRTEWHSLALYGKLADLTESYVKKGDKLAVEGSIRTRSWEKDGEKRYATDINVRDLTFLGTPNGAWSTSPAKKSLPVNPTSTVDDDDLPF